MSTPTAGKDYDFVFKIVLVGDTCVGKSCLLVRFSDDIFNESYVTTIGVDFRFKTMVVSDKVTKIQIWDTAGQERYRSITTAYYRGAAAIFICFDLTNHDSFANLNNWLDEVAKLTDSDINKLVLANKNDMTEKRKVTKEEIEAFTKRTGIEVVEVSAKTGNGVENAFKSMIEKLISQKDKKAKKSSLIITDENNRSGKCCK